ncbi:MAG TPA: IS66 family transposase [Candidatus Nanoarchaeia archaeon]|nr:IS66 family transposase [Candidatus Nanoarchaeia archaeon]
MTAEDKDKRIKELEDELQDFKKKYEKLKKEFEELKSSHALTVSNLRKALKIKANSKKIAKPIGAPKGHKGYARHIPERIDKIKELNIKRCPHCNTKLGETQEIRSRHVIDIKLTSKVKTTRFDIHRKYCPTCDRIVEPEVKQALPHARFGLNLMLLVMYLRLGLRLPCNKICEYFIDMFNLKISEGEIIGILKQLVVAFGDYYSYLEKLVKLARIKHSDTTSWRINGKNYVAWVFIACGVVLYKIRKSNCHKVGLVFLKKQIGNILVVDRHCAFRLLAKKAGFLLQLCWSHILQDTKQLAEEFGAEGRYIHKKLKEIYALAKGLNHSGNREIVEQLKAEVFQLTLRHYKHSIIRKFVNNLYYRDGNDLFRFVTDPEIDSTNNISERELRALVIIRKISYGSRSNRGANATAILLSIIQTLRLKKENVLQGLQAILKNASGY